MNEDQEIELKRKINEFIFTHGRAEMTLAEMELAACQLLEAMYPGSVPDLKERTAHAQIAAS